MPRKTTLLPDAVFDDTPNIEATQPLELRLAKLRETHPDQNPVSGRPFGISAEQRIVLCESLRGGNYRRVACQVAGVSYSTFAAWMKRGGDGEDGERVEYEEPYRGFVDDVHKAEADGEIELVDSIRQAGKTDWKASAWLLSKRNKDNWSDNNNNIHVGTTGGVTIVLPSNNRELDKGSTNDGT